jgi:type I restriction enzyme S subunit
MGTGRAVALTSHHAPGSGPRRFKPYPEYKDSGVEWIGSIPTHWGTEPLFTIARERKQRNAGNQVENVLSLSYGKIVRRDIATNFGLLPESFDTYQLVEPGNIVLRLTDLQNDKRSLRVGLVEELGIITSAYVGLDLYRRLTPSYGFYLLHAYDVTKVFYALGAGVRQTMKFDDLKWMPVLVPEPDEQRAIAAFLDRETAKIDALVAKKERLIELLHEKRTAVITRAVTKGLAPNVPMKDSGVEWLGEIPAHWEVEGIKWAARMESGHTPDKKVESYWVGGDIPWVSLADTGQLREVDYIADTAVMTTPDGIAHSSAHILPAGTVVFSRDATIGLCAITRAGMAVSQHFIGWVCSARLQPEYLLFVLRSMTQELERLTMGATVRTIGMPDVRSLVTPIPPVPEQERIVLHVHKNRSQIDALVGKVRDAIDRLKELRTVLISAAVTGKIDVRGEAA